MDSPICHCGTASQHPHKTGTYGCVRYVTNTPKLVGIHPELKCNMWDVGDGDIITEYTLKYQRGYHLHENGVWTRSSGSSNSICD